MCDDQLVNVQGGQCTTESPSWKSIQCHKVVFSPSFWTSILVAVNKKNGKYPPRTSTTKNLPYCSSNAFKDENSWLTCDISSLEDNIQKVIKLKIWNHFTHKVQCLDDTEQNASLLPVKVSLSSLGFQNILKSSLATVSHDGTNNKFLSNLLPAASEK